ncbi:MAG: GntR family transcriptional regulator [Oscillospiraceae bacterium]|nr:GntR family transcriptional regulator [Oscillospiraceae bacterium]
MQFEIRDSRPIWQQLAQQLRERIVKGEYPPGSHFPTVRELAAQAGVNPNTMQRAMGQLEADGLVITNRTAGRTVTEREDVLAEMRRTLAIQRTEEYMKDLQALGLDRAAARELLGAKGEENHE